METFLNVGFTSSVHLKFLVKHIVFSIIWLLGVMIFVFRIDLNLFSNIVGSQLLVLKMIPFFFFCVVVITMFLSKWYYNIALVFYPLLIVFWFLPKYILSNGKIYLFSNYINAVYLFVKNIKRNITYLLLFVFVIFILFITDSNFIRIICLIIISCFYYRFVINYLIKSFRPPCLFGVDVDKVIQEFIICPDRGMLIVKSIEERKEDEKHSVDSVKMKRLKRLILLNYFIVSFKDNLNGFNGKKAFVISWMYQLLMFLIVTLMFYTFVNYELFIISKSNFTTIGNCTRFDFFYYTIKTITFSNIDNIVGLSVLARVVEILSFLTLGIFLFIIVTSIIFSLRQDRIGENVKKATELCVIQDKLIIEYIRNKYHTDIQTVLEESNNISASLNNLKNVIAKIF